MLKVEELRIGNWIDYKGQHHIQWSIEDYGEWGKNIEQLITPIELTEEWLVKLGFEDASSVGINSLRYRNGCLKIRLFKNGNMHLYLHDVMFDSIKIKHVHQLQNLYFALTQKELKIEESTKNEVST